MLKEARKYFQSYDDRQRTRVKEIIAELRELEHKADKHERHNKRKVLNTEMDPITVFHMVRLTEYIGAIADHAENTGDMMRAMIAK